MGYSGYWRPLVGDSRWLDETVFYAGWVLTLAADGLRWQTIATLAGDLLWLTGTRYYMILRSLVSYEDFWRGLYARRFASFPCVE